MDQKLSINKVKNYTAAFNAVVLKDFFKNHERITGKEILDLTPVKQVNLLIIHTLMIRWSEEVGKLKSPYFDYSHEEVKTAFSAFRNTLSKHISIAEKEFEPLLEKAVADTLRIILSPYDFYADALDTGGQGKVSIQKIQNLVRYLKINQKPLEELVNRIKQKEGSDLLSGREAFALLDSILEEGFNPENPENHLKFFSTIHPVSMKDLTESVIIPKKSESFTSKSESPKKPQTVGAVQTTLYDELGKDSRPTLADDFQKKKINRLRDHLTINQKFMFTKTLFNGDFDLFGQAIDRIDILDNIQQARQYLELNYPEWNRDSEEYLNFTELLERRFL